MNSIPDLLVYPYAALLIIAAIQDVKSLRISNIWPVSVLLVSLVAIVASWNADWWQHLVSFAGVLAVTMFMFTRGWIGGGDAKLFAAAAAWFDFEGLLVFLPAVLLTGGLITLLLVMLRMMLPKSFLERTGWASLKKRGPVPYGVPIAIGSIAAAFT